MNAGGLPLRAVATVLASLALHAVVAALLGTLPPREVASRPSRVEVRLVAPPPEPPPEPPPPEPEPTPEPAPEPEVVEPEPEPEPTPPPRKPPPRREKAPPKAKESPKPTPTERPTAPTERPDANADDAEPVFGIDMHSTSAKGAGAAVRAGNTLQGGRDDGPAARERAKPMRGAGAVPIPADVVSKMPLPLGKCGGTYTEEARSAGVEGMVELELVVDADGVAQQVKVLRGLGYGLDEAAIAAVKRCRFSPGERGGEKVAVKIRSFKIRFFLGDAI